MTNINIINGPGGFSASGPGLSFFTLPYTAFPASPPYPASVTRDGTGYGLIYLRDGSTPSGRLTVSLGGSPGAPIPLAPGGRIKQPFQSLTFQPGGYYANLTSPPNGGAAFGSYVAGSPQSPKGTVANFIVLTDPSVDYDENDYSNPVYAPVVLARNPAATFAAPDGLGGGGGITSALTAGWSVLRFSLWDPTPGSSYLVTPLIVGPSDSGFQLSNAAFTLGPSSATATTSNYAQIINLQSYAGYPGLAIGPPPGGNSILAFAVDYVGGPGAPATVGLMVEGIG